MNKKTKIQENKAITLIALVITIIVLIILAGVTINLTLGQNGLFTRAKQASEDYRIAKEKEELEIEIANIQTQIIKEEGRIATLQDLYSKIDKTKYVIELSNEDIADVDSTIVNPTYALVNKIESDIYFTVDKKLVITKVKVKGKASQKEEKVKISNITWSNGKASVELSTKETGTIEYKVGKDGIYQAGTTISNLSNGDIVYTRVNNNGTYTDEDILEIKDTIEPEEFTITASDITYEGVKLTGSTQDLQTGIRDYTYVAETKTNEIVKEIANQTVTEYTITGLNEETEYVVYMLAYDNAGNVRKSNEVTVTTGSIPSNVVIGEYIDYQIDLNGDGDTTNDWMIFYKANGNAEGEEKGGAYETNIGDYYIIAADYLKNTDERLMLENLGILSKRGEYSIYWTQTDAVPDAVQVTGTENLNKTGRTINQLFMQNKLKTLKNYENSRAMSTFTNTANWDGYVNINYADYAIGAPTIEMFVASWNIRYEKQLKLYTNVNNIGYYVGTGSNSTTSYSQILTSITDWKDNKLYFPHEDKTYNDCYGNWLASPSACDNYAIFSIGANGAINDPWYYGTIYCARPVVHLKSGTRLQKVDGVWRIQ